MIRVVLPSPLRSLAKTPEEIHVDVTGVVSVIFADLLGADLP